MPQTRRLIWLPEAATDIARLRRFIQPHNPKAARRAAQCIKAAANQLIEFPEIGKPLQDGTERRELYAPFGNGAYVLRYQLKGEDVVILRVWHSREDRESSHT